MLRDKEQKRPVPVYPEGFYVPPGVPGDRVTLEGHLYDDKQIDYIEKVVASAKKEQDQPRYSKELFTDEKIIPLKHRSGVELNGDLFAIYNTDGSKKTAQHSMGGGAFSPGGLKLTFNLKTKKWGLLKTQYQVFTPEGSEAKDRLETIRKEHHALQTTQQSHGALLFRNTRRTPPSVKKLDIFMEYARGEELYYLIQDHNQKKCILPIATKIDIALKLMYALENLHALGFWHCDIKPENIIYDSATGKLTLIDLGLVLEHNGADQIKTDTPRGTFDFMAPNHLKSYEYSAKEDIYSSGMVFKELFSLSAPSWGSLFLDWATGTCDNQTALFQLISTMTSPLRDKRPSIQKSIEALKMIYNLLPSEELEKAKLFQQQAHDKEIQRLNKVYLDALAIHQKKGTTSTLQSSSSSPPALNMSPTLFQSTRRPQEFVIIEEYDDYSCRIL